MQTTDNQDDINVDDILDDEDEPSTGADEDTLDDEGEDIDADEEEGEEDAPDNGSDDPRIPDKFKGKTAAEIAEAYTHLEGLVHTRALEIAQGLLGGKMPDKQAVAEDKEEDADDLGLSEEDLAKMTPKEFLAHINRVVTTKAERMVAETMKRSQDVKRAVSQEVREVTKTYPHLKTNVNFRNVVLDMMDAAKARGQKLTLKDACKKATDIMGIKPEAAAPVVPKKKLRTGVERVRPTDGGENKTDEDRVKEGLLGGKSTSALGGLGI